MFHSGCGFIWPRKFIQMGYIPGNVCFTTCAVRRWKLKSCHPSQWLSNLTNGLELCKWKVLRKCSVLLLTLLEFPSSWLCVHIFVWWFGKGRKQILHIRILRSSLSLSYFLPTGILHSASSRCEESKKIKQDAYEYDLTRYCLLVLRQDHSRARGGWATAVQLAEILR